MAWSNEEFLSFVEKCSEFDLYLEWGEWDGDGRGKYRRYVAIYTPERYGTPRRDFPRFQVRMAYTIAQEAANELRQPVRLTLDAAYADEESSNTGNWGVKTFQPQTGEVTMQDKTWIDEKHPNSQFLQPEMGPRMERHYRNEAYNLPLFSAITNSAEQSKWVFRSGSVEIPLGGVSEVANLLRFCQPPESWTPRQMVNHLRQLRKIEEENGGYNFMTKYKLLNSVATVFAERLFPGERDWSGVFENFDTRSFHKPDDGSASHSLICGYDGYVTGADLDRFLVKVEDARPGSFMPEEVAGAEYRLAMKTRYHGDDCEDPYLFTPWRELRTKLAGRYGSEKSNALIRRLKLRRMSRRNVGTGAVATSTDEE